MQASSSRQLKEVGRVIVTRPVFCALPHTKRLTAITILPIYKENYGDSGRGATYSTKSKFFLKNSQNTIDKCTII